jgi:hypothetical protein
MVPPATAPARTGGDPGDDATDVIRAPRSTRVLRLAVVAVVVVLLGWGSWKADDDAFPVGPFVMFAFTTPPNGEVRSAAVEAVDVTGDRLPVVLEPEDVGLRRAEMEGQISRVVAHPELLGALATAHLRLRPNQPAWQQVELVEHRVQLDHGRATHETTVVLATWHR